MEMKEKFHDWDHQTYLVDWLLDSSEFHVLLCQGIHNQMLFGIWRPQDCVEESKRLEYHPGFPSGVVHLRDPVLCEKLFQSFLPFIYILTKLIKKIK